MSCITSHDEITYLPIESVEEEDDTSTTAISAGEDGSSVSTRGDGVSMAELQRSLKAASSENSDGGVSTAAGSFGGKIKVRECVPVLAVFPFPFFLCALCTLCAFNGLSREHTILP